MKNNNQLSERKSGTDDLPTENLIDTGSKPMEDEINESPEVRNEDLIEDIGKLKPGDLGDAKQPMEENINMNVNVNNMTNNNDQSMEQTNIPMESIAPASQVTDEEEAVSPSKRMLRSFRPSMGNLSIQIKNSGPPLPPATKSKKGGAKKKGGIHMRSMKM